MYQTGYQGGVKRKRDDQDAGEVVMDDISFVGLSDMCAPEADQLKEYHDGYTFHDDTTVESLDPISVNKACEDELRRFEHM